jgi:SAM-dependent methyltransferase
MVDTMILVDKAELAIRAHDLWGAQLELDWLKNHNSTKHESLFKKNGFACLRIPQECALGLRNFFDNRLTTPFDQSDFGLDFFGTQLSEVAIEQLNADNIYFSPPSIDVQAYLANFLHENSAAIEHELGCRWRVVNVRAWETRKGANYGPSDWHIDGGARCMRKIMFYPLPPNKQNGSLELFDRQDNKYSLEFDYPVAVLLDSSVLLHRGVPGSLENRPAIEVTIIPAEYNNVDLVFSGQNARYLRRMPQDIVAQLNQFKFSAPIHLSFKKKSVSFLGATIRKAKKLPARINRAITRRVKSYIFRAPRETLIVRNSIANLNIGGGPLFDEVGWVNLEGSASEINAYPFFFSETCIFPIPSGVVSTVYSSHCLEHLNDGTVDRVLQEAKRVLNFNGRLILKLPNFELTKASWAEGDANFFKEWSLEELLPLWRAAGIEDSLTNKASMIFCGYWNKSYGDHFSRKISFIGDAYHGPAKAPKEEVERLLSSPGCHSIASWLVNYV